MCDQTLQHCFQGFCIKHHTDTPEAKKKKKKKLLSRCEEVDANSLFSDVILLTFIFSFRLINQLTMELKLWFFLLMLCGEFHFSKCGCRKHVMFLNMIENSVSFPCFSFFFFFLMWYLLCLSGWSTCRQGSQRSRDHSLPVRIPQDQENPEEKATFLEDTEQGGLNESGRCTKSLPNFWEILMQATAPWCWMESGAPTSGLFTLVLCCQYTKSTPSPRILCPLMSFLSI